jgi:hypothetical protein
VSGAPDFDPERGRLLIGEDAMRVLVAHAADPIAVAAGDAVSELAALQAAGVISGGRAHPALAGAVAAIVRPELCTLELSHSGKAMQGWVSYDAAALLLPEASGDDGRRALLAVHPTVLPVALAELVELGPRPVADGAAPVVYLPDAIDDVHRRWRLEAAWRLEDGAAGGDGLEVLDTASGLWMLTTGDEGGPPIAWPVTPTLIWRHIVRIVMRRAADDAVQAQ